jgi:REP element-mobilizing transposase RayT
MRCRQQGPQKEIRAVMSPVWALDRFALIRACFAKARKNQQLRLVELSVLSNHLHLIVEADSSTGLSRGVQDASSRITSTRGCSSRRRKW